MEKMITVYSDADYLAVYKQKKRLWTIFCIVTAIYLAYCIGWLVYHISLPYKDPMQKLAQAMVFVASGVYVIFCFPYLAIKYSRVRRYFKLIDCLSSGLKNEEKNYFYCFEEKSLQKDNIDVIGCIFETWNKKKCEWMDREAYWDLEKPLPSVESGDYVQYITQSNFIVQYRILQKQALEFEEVDENGEPLNDQAQENQSAPATDSTETQEQQEQQEQQEKQETQDE